MSKWRSFVIMAEVRLNLHDLNNELSAGNVTMIRMVKMMTKGKNGYEPSPDIPAVSGRMLKHWHWEHYRNLVKENSEKFQSWVNGRKWTESDVLKDNQVKTNGVPLCPACYLGETIRPAILKNEKWEFVNPAEGHSLDDTIVNLCAACDTHGFLVASGNRSERRTSRVYLSWMLPTEETVEKAANTVVTVTHSRVQKTQYKQEAGEKGSQMVFDKSYASGVYGFVGYVDLHGIGRGLKEVTENGKIKEVTETLLIDPQEQTLRQRLAVEAFQRLLFNERGASLSHAFPHSRVEKLLLILSEETVPIPASPIYNGWMEETATLMQLGKKMYFFAYPCDKWSTFISTSDNTVLVDKAVLAFEELLKKLDGDEGK